MGHEAIQEREVMEDLVDEEHMQLVVLVLSDKDTMVQLQIHIGELGDEVLEVWVIGQFQLEVDMVVLEYHQ